MPGKLAQLFTKALVTGVNPSVRGSVSAFAERAELSWQTADRLLNGAVPDLDQLEAAARGLGIDPVAMITEPGEKRWERLPGELLESLETTDPRHYPAILALLTGFAIQREPKGGPGCRKSAAPKRPSR